MDFDLAALADDSAAAGLARDIAQSYLPAEEDPEVRLFRMLEDEARAERDRQRRAETRALHEFNVAREQERRQQAARTAAQAASRERYERQQRERDAQHDRGRLAVLEARQRADQDRQAQAARDNATQDHWRQLDELSAGLSRLLEPPARDHTAERVAALEAELEAQAHERAFASEERRRAAYQERSRAAVARRETRGW